MGNIFNRLTGLFGLIFLPLCFPTIVLIRYVSGQEYVSLWEVIKVVIKLIKTGEG